MSGAPEVFVEMADVVGVVGLRGEVKLLPTGNFDAAVLSSAFLRGRDARGTVRLRCERHRWKGNVVIARLAGIEDRDAARALVGSTLGFEARDYDASGFPRGDRPPPFVYLGLRVETVDGRGVGWVDDVLVLPANWVLRVLAPAPDGDGETEVLVPVIDSVVVEVDRDRGRVVIDPLPGLLDDSPTA